MSEIRTLMNRTFPLASDSLKLAICWTHFTFIFLMMVKRFAWVFFWAELNITKNKSKWSNEFLLNETSSYLTFIRQLAHCFFYSQITRSRRFGNFNTAIRARCNLIAQSKLDFHDKYIFKNFIQTTNKLIEITNLPSASKCVKQAAHIKCPIWHCK